MTRERLVPLLSLAAVALAAILLRGAAVATPSAARFDGAGALERPEGFEEWIFVGASLGLSYAAHDSAAPQLFHNVYLEPRAYRHFVDEGVFPDGTVLVLELLEAAEKVAPSRHGLSEGRRLAVEAAVKDRDRFTGGWAYFDFGLDRPTAAPQPDARCAACHREHAARDNVFTQFYPVLRRKCY